MVIWDFFILFKGEVVFVGVVGVVVFVVMEWMGWVVGFCKFLIGGIMVYYIVLIGVLIVEWMIGKFFVILELNLVGVGGFFMGIGGVVIVEIMLKVF